MKEKQKTNSNYTEQLENQYIIQTKRKIVNFRLYFKPSSVRRKYNTLQCTYIYNAGREHRADGEGVNVVEKYSIYSNMLISRRRTTEQAGKCVIVECHMKSCSFMLALSAMLRKCMSSKIRVDWMILRKISENSA